MHLANLSFDVSSVCLLYLKRTITSKNDEYLWSLILEVFKVLLEPPCDIFDPIRTINVHHNIRTYHDGLADYILAKASFVASIDYIDHININIKASLAELVN